MKPIVVPREPGFTAELAQQAAVAATIALSTKRRMSSIAWGQRCGTDVARAACLRSSTLKASHLHAPRRS